MSERYSIVDPHFWELDRRDCEQMIALYVGTRPEDVHPERALEAAIMAMQDVGRTCEVMELIAYQVGRLTTVVEQLQVQQPQHGKPRGRPRQRLTVRANPERQTVHFVGKRMSVEQARDLGKLLLNAADEAEGVQDEWIRTETC